MITTLEIRTSQGTLLTLPLGDISSGYSIQNIDGLDPVVATLVSSSFANIAGEQYQSSRREKRNIKLSLGLEADFITNSVSDLRERLYSFLMPKSEVKLRFYTSSGLVVEIVGMVESLTAPPFAKEPAVDISIICFNPDFYVLDATILHKNTTSTEAEILVQYPGTVETGLIFTLHVNRSLSGFTIYHRPPDGSFRSMDFEAALIAGDVLEVCTITGSKYARLTRAGSVTSILYAVSPQANWIELGQGDNYIRVYATGSTIPYDLNYVVKYGGL